MRECCVLPLMNGRGDCDRLLVPVMVTPLLSSPHLAISHLVGQSHGGVVYQFAL